MINLITRHYNSQVITEKQFSNLGTYISIYMDIDQDYFQFWETCFRYSEIKKLDLYNEKILSDNKVIQEEKKERRNSSKLKLFKYLIEKHYFFKFYYQLNMADFNSKMLVLFKDFKIVLKKIGIELSEKDVLELFEEYSGNQQSLNYHLMLEDLVPFLNKN